MDVRYLGEDCLRRVSQPVTVIDDTLKSFIRQMFKTMEKDGGIGLAAPQVGENIRLFIVKIDDGIERVFINPQIIGTSEDVARFEEGCLSIPNIYADVIRSAAITIQYQDINGRRKTVSADGLLARVIQHEYDHLEGVLFVDRLADEEKEKLIARFEMQQERKARQILKRKARRSC